MGQACNCNPCDSNVDSDLLAQPNSPLKYELASGHPPERLNTAGGDQVPLRLDLAGSREKVEEVPMPSVASVFDDQLKTTAQEPQNLFEDTAAACIPCSDMGALEQEGHKLSPSIAPAGTTAIGSTNLPPITEDETDGSPSQPPPARPSLPAEVNGCACEFDPDAAEKSGALSKTDPIQAHYKKGGLFGAVTGAFGDKKTMYCHHMTADGQVGPRAAAKAGIKCTTTEEVWRALGKNPCHGRFAYNRATGKLKCGGVVKKDHDNTCNKETCLFIASGLKCPTPEWAFK